MLTFAQSRFLVFLCRVSVAFLMFWSLPFYAYSQTTAVSNMSKNVMMLGKDNELHIIQESSPCHSLTARSDNGTIKNLGKCKFIYKPERKGLGQIVVKGPKGEYNYLVRVEEPTTFSELYVGNHPPGPIKKTEFTNQLGVIAKDNRTGVSLPIKVLSYSVMIVRENKIVKNFGFKGPRFTPEAIAEFNKLQMHDHVVFYNVVVENESGNSQYLQPAEFIINY